MAYRVWLTESARQDLDELFSYIINELANPSAAQGFADSFTTKVQQLEHHPFMYSRAKDTGLASKGYRSISIGNHVVLYKVLDDDREVVITRVFYGKRDYSKLL